jgi:hypothetical protein
MQPLSKFLRLTKIDEATHTVWGIATSETPDSTDEICDYDSAKQAFNDWSEEFEKRTVAAGQERSLGCVRVMHSLDIGGKITRLHFDDSRKEVHVGSEPATAEVWDLLQRGILTGYSVGGSYAWKRPEGKYTRFGLKLSELSYVDSPCNKDAVFEFVRTDGTNEVRKFQPKGGSMTHIEKITKHIRTIGEAHKKHATSVTTPSERDFHNVLAKAHTDLADAFSALATDLDARGSFDGKPFGTGNPVDPVTGKAAGAIKNPMAVTMGEMLYGLGDDGTPLSEAGF